MEIDLDVITEKLDEEKKKRAELKFYLNSCEKEIEKLELQLIAVLSSNKVNEMVYKGYSFGWKDKTRKAFDQKLFQEEHQDLYEQYKTEKTTQVFEFKVGA